MSDIILSGSGIFGWESFGATNIDLSIPEEFCAEQVQNPR